MAGVDLSAAVNQERDDHQRDHEEHGPRCPQMTAVKARLAFLARRCILDADEREHDQRDQHRRGEEVLGEGQPIVASDERDMEVATEERPVGLEDRGHQYGESPHGEEVRQPGYGPLQELLLTGDFDDLGLADLAQPLPAARGALSGADQFREPVETSPGDREEDDGYPETNDDAS
jgi:hypothetical protein